MSHWLIVGQTMTGKTTFARDHLVPQYRAKGIPVAVCDPLEDPKWDADFVTKDIEEFVDFAEDPQQSLGCALFVDEGALSFTGKKFDARLNFLTCVSRHHGHMTHLISQTDKAFNPTMRGQCNKAAIFNIDADFAKDIARNFNLPIIREVAPTLAFGECLIIDRGARSASPFKVWWARDKDVVDTPSPIGNDTDSTESQ